MTEARTSEMVECVARAMIKPLGQDPAKDWSKTYVGGLCDAVMDNSLEGLCMSLSRAAIEAMREPTQFMLDEAGDTITVGCCNMQLKDARDTWLCMIDAALSDDAS